ncbi:Peptidyl-prolyl cis-trans isomerase [Caligus rogercresseyi]|uniref:Peptidyl-prolyl cis-trans isomerase n=1 Tax=Caligus rogercresseyi TaxID=217165 RepID=A0A7T8JU65_CALRO|nr:Peptidyl-prolyl cis-trans isomerase [Caligus rogercresseyi]
MIKSSFCSENQMYPGVSRDGFAHFPNFKGKGGILEGLLHLLPPKGPQVPSPLG